MNDIATNLIYVVLLLGLMILVHEWGHYIVARLCKVRVDVFSIGFGPRLWGWKRGATDYRLSLLPLGGYVKMAGDNPGEDRSGAPDEFLSRPRWQRALVVLAGPVMNVLMAFLLIAGLFYFEGIPSEAYLTRPPELAGVPKDSPAARAGLQFGDRIVKMNGLRVGNWEQVVMLFAKVPANGTVKLVIERGAETLTVEVAVESPPSFFGSIGYPPFRPKIEHVSPGTPAYRAGLRPDDEVLSLNGVAIATWFQFAELIRASGGQELALAIRREGRDMEFKLRPEQRGFTPEGKPYWQLGVLPVPDVTFRPAGVAEASRQAVVAGASTTMEVVRVVARLFTGRESLRNMQSVIGISREAGQAARRGLSSFVRLMAIISLNLGILNLLPIPILDGGHLLMLSIEGLRRRDLSLAVKERFVQFGMVFLLVVIAFVMYNDVVRLWPR
jgi:regulator of sigma E protease